MTAPALLKYLGVGGQGGGMDSLWLTVQTLQGISQFKKVSR